MSKTLKQELAKAFNASANTSTSIHLSQEEASTFVDMMVDQSQVMQRLRVVKMDRAKYNIGRIIDGGRFLRPGGQDVEATAYRASTDNITLISKEVIGKIDIHDDELRHNIEGQSLEATLLAHVNKKVRNELLEIAFYADTASTPTAGNEVLKQIDGFFKKLSTGSGVVDFSQVAAFPDAYPSKDKFRAMIKTLPVQFRQEAEFFLQNDLMLDYNALFDESYNRDQFIGKILGRNANEVPLFQYNSNGQSDIIYTPPMNLIIGIQVEDASIQFERERIPGKRKTSYHFSMEFDVAIESKEAAVVGKNMETR